MARTFFRRLEVVGAEQIPAAGPVLVVANHVNGLIDPLLVAATMPFFPRMLAKSTLWNITALRPILALAGVVPVYRRHDAGVDTSRNAEMFARTHEVLAAGGSIALFPEGISHNQPELAPLRTGAARMVLEAEALHGPLSGHVLPVGLTFEDKGRFRSRALVRVGRPVPVADFLDRYRREPKETVRALTDRIGQALREITLNFKSWEQAALLSRAVEVFERPAVRLPGRRALAESFVLRRAFLEGQREMEQRFPAEVAEASRAVARYDELLRAAHLRDEQVAARYPVPGILGWLLRNAVLQALFLPLALVGMLLNWMPYRIAGLVAKRFKDEPDQWATWKLFPSLVLYPVFWLLAAGLGGWLARSVGESAWWGALALALGPLTGWFALRYQQRRGDWWREARAFLLLKTRKKLARELRRRRGQAYAAVTHLANLFLETRSPESR